MSDDGNMFQVLQIVVTYEIKIVYATQNLA